jgi:hypothetical protein
LFELVAKLANISFAPSSFPQKDSARNEKEKQFPEEKKGIRRKSAQPVM